ncbi:hypothetical protein SAMN06265373_10357 [Shimia sagamensis]|uniref:Transposase DDE domain-containing protein n=1 Tax=Shimia sagamensis TaxID=1566352 RepID=A0ABY1NRR2_9RHOB|nr:hypothetical protein SAMN06265373_10357 [Shimia sagamensis]
MLDRVKDRFDLDPEWVIADTAYGSGPMLGWLVDRNIAPHIPVIDKAGRTDGTWSRADFECDAQNNQYICPEGEPLKQFRRNYSDPNRGPTGKGVARYRALKGTCQACTSKNNCCPKADAQDLPRRARRRQRCCPRHQKNTAVQELIQNCARKSKCSLRTSSASLGWGGCDCAAPLGIMAAP